MKDNNCIFCKIASGDIPSHTVYEDDDFRVILDISPASKGHVLILPKEHAKDIIELKSEKTKRIMEVVKKIGEAQMKAIGATGFNTLINTGASAGQTVFHCHIHVIPRFESEKKILTWNTLSYEDGELEDYATSIIKAL